MFTLLLGLIQKLKKSKVDKIPGMGLSTNDFTNTDKINLEYLSSNFTRGISETLLVQNNRITLSYKPKNNLILNFSMVRNLDTITGVSYDIPVIVDFNDSEEKTFVLMPNFSGQFDNKNVSIQYFYDSNI